MRHCLQNLRELIAFLTEGLGELGLAVREQVDAARVVTGSASMADVDVPHVGARVAAPNGPLPVVGVVIDDVGSDVGELLIWIRDGWLIGLEQTWFTDEPPSRWPSPEGVRLS